MKNIDEIKNEIIQINENIEELSYRLKKLSNEINVESTEINSRFDYKKIEILSCYCSFSKHILSEINNEYLKELYLKVLLSAISLEEMEEKKISQLVYAQWILSQSKLNKTLKSLYENSLMFDEKTIVDIREEFETKLVDNLLLDLLLVANFNGESSDKLLSYISEYALVMNISKEFLKSMSVFVKCIIIRNFNEIDIEYIKQLITIYRNYITEEDFTQCMEQYRVFHKKTEISNRTWTFYNRQQVKKGYRIASDIVGNNSHTYAFENIIAQCTGTLFIINHGTYTCGVISHECDNSEAIKKWLIRRGLL